jgi:hypothetical protein
MQEQRDFFSGNVVGLSNTHDTVWISPIIYASQIPHLDPTYPLLMGYYLPRLFTIH